MNIFFRKKKNKNIQNKALAALFAVLLLAVAINVVLYQANSNKKNSLSGGWTESANRDINNEIKPAVDDGSDIKEMLAKNEGELDHKIKQALNIRPVRQQRRINGVIEKLEGEHIYVSSCKESPEKIKLTPDTLYVKMITTNDYQLKSQNEITDSDLLAGASVSVIYAIFENENGKEEPTALIVKLILSEK